MERILVTGALGQIGSELVAELRNSYGSENVVASDIRVPRAEFLRTDGPFEYVDCTNQDQIQEAVVRHRIDTIYHLAALLSAVAEEKPQQAWEINMGGLFHVLEVARKLGCSVFTPSSIGAFGSETPKDLTPQDTLQRPSTMYGVTKVAGELLCDYYYERFGVDTRGVRFPGIISHVAQPGGGTTDYAVEIFYQALRYEHFTCFLTAETRLDMMYMPDAIRAAVKVMEAEPGRLVHRNAFNVTAMNFTPEELADAIRAHIPGFVIEYDPDPVRQKIADSWPNSLDDSSARSEWDWQPQYDLESMVADMIDNLRRKLKNE
ncbi:MAG: L-threonine 3-dehydrogenase [Thermoanaerobaculia bacterium]|nr:L-threonine 3-dehydrogenase [Thermoanaerobaculia bacterium]